MNGPGTMCFTLKFLNFGNCILKDQELIGIVKQTLWQFVGLWSRITYLRGCAPYPHLGSIGTLFVGVPAGYERGLSLPYCMNLKADIWMLTVYLQRNQPLTVFPALPLEVLSLGLPHRGTMESTRGTLARLWKCSHQSSKLWRRTLTYNLNTLTLA